MRDETLATYEAHADRYAERTSGGRSTLVAELVDLTAAGSRVLELGSGPGRDAADLERAGLVVDRTDGAAAFVERFRRKGFEARLLNFYDTAFYDADFSEPYDAVFANAVLLHVDRDRLAGVPRSAPGHACRRRSRGVVQER
ncbi:hypothetical protein AX769_12455 [Frondihabitans sp. PAMC 28766]|nr:hypothetical protein AX769_12455 [Frondihabitans sp. PAMC 28766]